MSYGNPMKITHYINPQVFWFFEYTNKTEYQRVIDIEADILKFYQTNDIVSNYVPEVNDRVAVNFFPWKKIIRGDVRYILNEENKITKYIIWSIDHGFPVTTESKYIWKLPQEYCYEIDNIRYGGIEGILPYYEPGANSREQQYRSNDWDQHVCEQFERMLNDARHLYFVRRLRGGANKWWGDIIITDNDNVSMQAKSILCNLKLAMKIGINVRLSYPSCQEFEQQPWLTNNNLKRYKMNYVSEYNFKTSNWDEQVNDNESKIDNLKTNTNEKQNNIKHYNVQRGNYTRDKFRRNNMYRPIQNNSYRREKYNNNYYSKQKNTYIDNVLKKDNAANEQQLKEAPKIQNDSSKIESNENNLNKTELNESEVNKKVYNPYENITEENIIRSQKADLVLKMVDEDFDTDDSDTSCPEESSMELLNCVKKEDNELTENTKDDEDNSNIDESISKTAKSTINVNENLEATKCIEIKADNNEPQKPKQNETNETNKVTDTSKPIYAGNSDKSLLLKTADNNDNNNNSTTIPDSKILKAMALVDNITADAERNNISADHIISTKLPNVSTLNIDFFGSICENDNFSDFSETSEDLENEKYFQSNETYNYSKPNYSFINKEKSRLLIYYGENRNRNNFNENDDTQEDIAPSVKKEPTHNNGMRFEELLVSRSKQIDNILKRATMSYELITSKKKLKSNAKHNSGPQTQEVKSNIRALLGNSHVESTKENYELPDVISEVEKKALTNDSIEQKSAIDPIRSLKLKLSMSKLVEENMEEELSRKKILAPVLAHSKSKIVPIFKMSSIHFKHDFEEELHKLNINEPYRLQNYTWPYILRDHSVCIINSPKSGKTWSYLSTICYMIALRASYQYIPSSYGPIAIFLVPERSNIENLLLYIIRLVYPKLKIAVSYGAHDLMHTKMKLLCGCDLLMVTPSNLYMLLKQSQKEALFNANRLHHFVIDDIDQIMAIDAEMFSSVCNQIFKLSQDDILQVVAISSSWQPIFVPILLKFNKGVLIIGEFSEAAIYAKTKISAKLNSAAEKPNALLESLADLAYKKERTLIVCKDVEDLLTIVENLSKCGHSFVCYYKNAPSFQLKCTMEWLQNENFEQVLVCTDDAINVLPGLNNIQHLIHYSIPATWPCFARRFATMSTKMQNYVVTGFKRSSEDSVTKSLILLDEHNNAQLPRLLEFLKRQDLSNIPNVILEATEQVIKDNEMQRITEKRPMCSAILEFGKCLDNRCYFRHSFQESDQFRSEEFIPSFGDMRILVLRVISPTHYIARLLEYRASPNDKWQKVRNSEHMAQFMTNLNIYYRCNGNPMGCWPPNYNEIYVFKLANVYQRARVIEIFNSNATNQVNVTLLLIDTGEIVCAINPYSLFECYEEFKNFPQQTCHVRLLGVVPCDRERTWLRRTKYFVSKRIKSNIALLDQVHIKINFALANCIWIDTIVVLNYLPGLCQWITKTNIKKVLLTKKFAYFDRDVCLRILNAAKDYIILDIKKETTEEWNNILTKEWSQNNMEFEQCKEENESTDKTTKINVSNTEADWESSYDSDEELEHDIEKYRQENISANLKVFKGTNFEEEDTEKCTYDVIAHASQFENEKWINIPCNEFILVEFGDQEERNIWSTIYVRLIEEKYTNELKELEMLMEQHVSYIQEDYDMFPEYLLKSQSNCIVKHDGRYKRAKFYETLRFNNEILYWFFLCDYGFFLHVNKEVLHNDFLYETSKDIITFTPYQAIHCRLAGIECDRERPTDYWFTKKYLFIKAVAKFEPYYFGINSYNIELYETNELDNENSLELFHTKLVDIGHAVLISSGSTNNIAENVNDSYFENANDSYIENTNIVSVDLPKVSVTSLLEVMQRCVAMDELEKHNKDYIDIILPETKRLANPQSLPIEIIEIPTNNDLTGTLEPITDADVTSNDILKECIAQTTTISINDATANDLATLNANTVLNKTLNAIDATSSPVDASITNIGHTPEPTDIATIESNNNFYDLPTLDNVYSCPQTTWAQTDFFIVLRIHLPEVNYLLHVTEKKLICVAADNSKQVLVINFLGLVQPNNTFHERRGLAVYVRLLKSIYVEWPRLLKQPYKFNWLNFDFGSFNTEELQGIMPKYSSWQSSALSDSSFESESSEGENFIENLSKSRKRNFEDQDNSD